MSQDNADRLIISFYFLKPFSNSTPSLANFNQREQNQMQNSQKIELTKGITVEVGKCLLFVMDSRIPWPGRIMSIRRYANRPPFFILVLYQLSRIVCATADRIITKISQLDDLNISQLPPEQMKMYRNALKQSKDHQKTKNYNSWMREEKERKKGYGSPRSISQDNQNTSDLFVILVKVVGIKLRQVLRERKEESVEPQSDIEDPQNQEDIGFSEHEDSKEEESEELTWTDGQKYKRLKVNHPRNNNDIQVLKMLKNVSYYTSSLDMSESSSESLERDSHDESTPTSDSEMTIFIDEAGNEEKVDKITKRRLQRTQRGNNRTMNFATFEQLYEKLCLKRILFSKTYLSKLAENIVLSFFRCIYNCSEDEHKQILEKMLKMLKTILDGRMISKRKIRKSSIIQYTDMFLKEFNQHLLKNREGLGSITQIYFYLQGWFQFWVMKKQVNIPRQLLNIRQAQI